MQPAYIRTVTVLAHGCFDLLHLGHIRHLQEARGLGDRLIVSITADRHVAKGFGRPQFSAEQRREALLALDCVDEVVISESGTAVEIIKDIRPGVYVKGIDYAGSDSPYLEAERLAVESVGGRMHITTAEKWSSTKLLRSVRLPDKVLAYLETARRRGFMDHILAAFERADKNKIVFIGETIIDEYHYVRPLAKPSKEFILATVADSAESFDGGVVAGAKHGGWANVRTVTCVDKIRKTRFVDADFSRKLFEVYSKQSIEMTEANRIVFRECLEAEIRIADIVIVMDFGHGMVGDVERKLIQGCSKFLAVTAQTNAGNYGFNSIGAWRAHYVCVDEQEARLATNVRHAPLGQVAFVLFEKTKADSLTVTCGRRGSASTYWLGGSLKEVPAFVDSGIDTMGAGDAFLAVAAPLVAVGLDIEMAAFAGNVAGGLKTSILGHRAAVGRDDIVKNMEWLLR